MPEMERIKCLVIDDEPPAREIMRRYIEQVPTLEMAGEFGNAIQAFTWLQQSQPVDLIFLDIRMPQLNGNELLKVLKNPPKVIFTTAYSEYALEGFELDAVDYLMKPVTFERFLKAVNKAYKSSTSKSEANTEERRTDPFVFFRADRKMVKVMLRDINYIESMKDYVKVYTTNGTIITKQSISSVEAMLPGKSFIRTHRSFIISVEKIKTFTAELIEIDKTEVPIGKLYRNEVLKVLG
jgi:DNA-binding LytR/AlgR family response regulator